MAEDAPDRPTSTAIHDVVMHLQQACALVNAVHVSLDPNAAPSAARALQRGPDPPHARARSRHRADGFRSPLAQPASAERPSSRTGGSPSALVQPTRALLGPRCLAHNFTSARFQTLHITRSATGAGEVWSGRYLNEPGAADPKQLAELRTAPPGHQLPQGIALGRTVHREWLTTFLSRKSAPNGAAVYIAGELARGGNELRKAFERGYEVPASLLGAESSDPRATLTAPTEAATDSRARPRC